MTNNEYVGTFEIETGNVIVSDPCYDLETSTSKIKHVKTGTWNAIVERCDNEARVGKLMAIHKNFNSADLFWTLLEYDIGVDSGQAGIFDVKEFKGIDGAAEDWYGKCCDLTLSDASVGLLPMGVVSSSGYGDGCYECWLAKDRDNEIVGIKVIFAEEDEVSLTCVTFDEVEQL